VLSLLTINPAPAWADMVMFRQGDGGAFSTTDATEIGVDGDGNFLANRGSITTMRAETDPTGSGSFRILIRFPNIFGTAVGQVPLGAAINAANLTLHTSSGGQSNNPHSVFLVLTDWAENTVTWPTFNQGGVAGVDYAGAPVAMFTPNASSADFVIDVTAHVQAWSNGASNLGVLVTNPGTDQSSFASEDTTVAANRPKLVIDFTAPAAVVVPGPSGLVLALGGATFGLFGLRRQRRKMAQS
jgi:hypothetical protein